MGLGMSQNLALARTIPMGSWAELCSLLKPTQRLVPAKWLTFRSLQHPIIRTGLGDEATNGEATDHSEGGGRKRVHFAD